MRRTLAIRSAREKPSPCEMFCRNSLPASSSTLRPRRRSSRSSTLAMVLFPEPLSPVSQTVKPFCFIVASPSNGLRDCVSANEDVGHLRAAELRGRALAAGEHLADLGPGEEHVMLLAVRARLGGHHLAARL